MQKLSGKKRERGRAELSYNLFTQVGSLSSVHVTVFAGEGSGLTWTQRLVLGSRRSHLDHWCWDRERSHLDHWCSDRERSHLDHWINSGLTWTTGSTAVSPGPSGWCSDRDGLTRATDFGSRAVSLPLVFGLRGTGVRIESWKKKRRKTVVTLSSDHLVPWMEGKKRLLLICICFVQWSLFCCYFVL